MKPEQLECRRVDDAIEAFVDGELSGAQRERVESHATTCPQCAEQIRLAERIRASVRALPKLDAPPHVIARVKAEAGRTAAGTPAPTPPARAARGAPAWVALAAAALVAALALAFLMPRSPAPSDAELERAANEARYALARVAQLTRKASVDAGRELRPRLLLPAVEGLERSLGRRRPTAEPKENDNGGTES